MISDFEVSCLFVKSRINHCKHINLREGVLEPVRSKDRYAESGGYAVRQTLNKQRKTLQFLLKGKSMFPLKKKWLVFRSFIILVNVCARHYKQPKERDCLYSFLSGNLDLLSPYVTEYNLSSARVSFNPNDVRYSVAQFALR